MLSERMESLADPRLDVYRSLKSTNATRDAQLFIAEGPTVVERVLRSDFRVRSVVISDRKFAAFEPRLPADVPVYRLTQVQAEELVGFAFHCGVMACAERRPPQPLETWLPAPENVGALIRIGAAFGAAGIVLGEGSADPFSRRVLRVSMGNGLFLPIVETGDLAGLLAKLQQQYAMDICLTVLDATARPLHQHHFAARTTLVFGNEYDGISEAVRRVSDSRLTIPMFNGTDSLNVAVSAGIFLHQYRSTPADA